MNDALNDKDHAAMTGALLDVVCSGPSADNELAIRALVDVLVLIVAGGVEGQSETNVNSVTTTIGETIADGVRQLHTQGRLQ